MFLPSVAIGCIHTGCPAILGYIATAGVDHWGDDIVCEATDPLTSASRCTADPSCKAFNVIPNMNNGKNTCRKTVSSPVKGPFNGCFYTKQNNGTAVGVTR